MSKIDPDSPNPSPRRSEYETRARERRAEVLAQRDDLADGAFEFPFCEGRKWMDVDGPNDPLTRRIPRVKSAVEVGVEKRREIGCGELCRVAHRRENAHAIMDRVRDDRDFDLASLQNPVPGLSPEIGRDRTHERFERGYVGACFALFLRRRRGGGAGV